MGNPVRVQISPRAPLLTRVGKHLLARVSHLSGDLSESGPRGRHRGRACSIVSVAVRRARVALSEQRELLPACIAVRLYDHVVDTTGDRSAPIV